MEGISQTFSFDTFKKVIEFLEKLRVISQEIGQYPEIHIYGQFKVKVTSISLKEGTVTGKDHILMQKLNKIVLN